MAGAASDGIYRAKYSEGNPGNVEHKHLRSFAVLLKQRAIRLFKEGSSSSLSSSPRLKSPGQSDTIGSPLLARLQNRGAQSQI